MKRRGFVLVAVASAAGVKPVPALRWEEAEFRIRHIQSHRWDREDDRTSFSD
jgi:hypothetical protein